MFAVGDEVLLDTINLDIAHTSITGKHKLAVRFIGSYRVLKTAGPDTYMLEPPPELKLHPDYHVASLFCGTVFVIESCNSKFSGSTCQPNPPGSPSNT
ncbi:hypothetical protein PHMEG_00023805 [Phytophthora megakarya]|uniref:Tf2-1-like SH3-like domain-containing protein n=1 Tax=Phytophthora megakarya TaxID=4795 RepID=A0A225VIG3_9STRA|nr:hypothetical protein PHMEG_00023805 [Phytophthora megakarya]